MGARKDRVNALVAAIGRLAADLGEGHGAALEQLASATRGLLDQLDAESRSLTAALCGAAEREGLTPVMLVGVSPAGGFRAALTPELRSHLLEEAGRPEQVKRALGEVVDRVVGPLDDLTTYTQE